MGRKVIHTILNLRDNMSGGLVKAAKQVKGVNREMLAATRTVERFQRKTADACSRAVLRPWTWRATASSWRRPPRTR